MIDAREAYRKSIINSVAQKEMQRIENYILKGIEDGKTSVTISTTDYEPAVKGAILEELMSLGYDVEYNPPKPLPAGCPSDQWDDCGYLKVKWEVKA